MELYFQKEEIALYYIVTSFWLQSAVASVKRQ